MSKLACVIATEATGLHSCGMLDPLIQRSSTALQENRQLREERARLLKQQEDALYQQGQHRPGLTRMTAATRIEVRARREDRK